MNLKMVNDSTITKEEIIDNKQRKKKIPKEISQEIRKKIFKTLLKAIGVMLYFITLNLAYSTMKHERLIGDIEVFASTFLAVGIIFIERAYKKDSGTIAINGIEFLFLALHSLSIMYIITRYKYEFQLYLLTSSYIFSIYYVLKSIILYTKGRRDYLKSLSDVSEIVKKDEPIKKEAKKRNEESLPEKKKKKKTNVKTEKEDTEEKVIRDEQKKPVKKRKKVDEKIEKNETVEEKKKTTPKEKSKVLKEEKITESKSKTKTKTENIKKKTTAKKVEVKEKAEEVVIPEKKKRGRPKKEVMKND